MATAKSKEKPDKIGALKFWTWSARDLSLSASVIVLGNLSLYCTNILGLDPLVVGTLLAASKIIDAITDLFAGYLVDRTNTKWGKGRPYEIAVLGVWFFTWLMYSAPAGAGQVVKLAYVFFMYMLVNSVFTTLLNASGNPYMVRAFKTNGQRVKLTTGAGQTFLPLCRFTREAFYEKIFVWQRLDLQRHAGDLAPRCADSGKADGRSFQRRTRLFPRRALYL